MTKSEFLGTSMNLNIAKNSYLKLKAISALTSTIQFQLVKFKKDRALNIYRRETFRAIYFSRNCATPRFRVLS